MAKLGTTIAPGASVSPGDVTPPGTQAGGTVTEPVGTQAAPSADEGGDQMGSSPRPSEPSGPDSGVGEIRDGEEDESGEGAQGRSTPPAQETPVERGSTPPVRRSWWRRMFVRNAG